MAYSTKVGSFNIDSSVTAGNDQQVTGVGFQPKVVLFWWSGSTASSDSVAGGGVYAGFGAASSSTSRYCAGIASDDAQATSDTAKTLRSDSCICVFSDGDATIDGRADFKSLDADGFTLTIDDQFGSDWRVSYLALGGADLTDVYLGDDTTASSTGNYNITGIGFQPDVVIIVAGQQTTLNAANPYADISIGMATGSSNQGVIYVRSNDNSATSATYGYGYNGEIISQVACQHRDAFVSFGADGFTLNHLEGSTAYAFWYVALAGGQYSVGDITTRTDTNDISETVGFEPSAVLFASANRALSTQDAATSHARLSIGAATSATERAVQAISDEQGLATTETAYTNQDDAVYAHVVDDAIEALMDLKSMDANGFTCVMDDVETSACWVTYLAIGAAGETLSVSVWAAAAAYIENAPLVVG